MAGPAKPNGALTGPLDIFGCAPASQPISVCAAHYTSFNLQSSHIFPALGEFSVVLQFTSLRSLTWAIQYVPCWSQFQTLDIAAEFQVRFGIHTSSWLREASR